MQLSFINQEELGKELQKLRKQEQAAKASLLKLRKQIKNLQQFEVQENGKEK